MKTRELTAILERVESWPESAQRQLAEVALEIEQGLTGEYHATPEELAGIERGLADARAGRFATDREVEAALAKFRRA
jgi:predicted transcriptional regulator